MSIATIRAIAHKLCNQAPIGFQLCHQPPPATPFDYYYLFPAAFWLFVPLDVSVPPYHVLCLPPSTLWTKELRTSTICRPSPSRLCIDFYLPCRFTARILGPTVPLRYLALLLHRFPLLTFYRPHSQLLRYLIYTLDCRLFSECFCRVNRFHSSRLTFGFTTSLRKALWTKYKEKFCFRIERRSSRHQKKLHVRMAPSTMPLPNPLWFPRQTRSCQEYSRWPPTPRCTSRTW